MIGPIRKPISNGYLRFLGSGLSIRCSISEYIAKRNGSVPTATLVALLGNKDDRIKRLTAKDVIDFIIRHKKNEDLDKRLTAVEKQLARQERT